MISALEKIFINTVFTVVIAVLALWFWLNGDIKKYIELEKENETNYK